MSNTTHANGISVKQLAEVLGKRPDNVKRDLKVLAAKTEDFPLHLWKADLPDSLGRLRSTYILPPREAYIFLATHGYNHARRLGRILPTIDYRESLKLAEALEALNLKAAEYLREIARLVAETEAQKLYIQQLTASELSH